MLDETASIFVSAFELQEAYCNRYGLWFDTCNVY